MVYYTGDTHMDIHDGNPFNATWLNGVAEGPPALAEDEAGESIIIEQLVKVVSRIVEFDVVIVST